MSSGQTSNGESRQVPQHGMHFLLVEDQRRDEQLIAAQLHEAGLVFELTRVQTRDEFTATLARQHCDVILSDYNVPGFDGSAALAAARVACPETPFIFVSGALGEERAIELLKRGATDYVLKDRLERLVPSVLRALQEVQEREERKRTEERLRQSEERSRTLVSALTEGVILQDARGAIQEANLSAQKLLGFDAPDLLGRLPEDPRWNLIDEDGATLAPENFPHVTALRSGRGVVGQVMGLRRSDGRLVWLSVNSQPLFDRDGVTPIAVVSSFSDISEQKRRAEFEQQLLGIVSHDLRDPIAVILMAAHVLLKQESLTERAHKSAARILSSAERASRLIRDLLDFTQARLGGGIHIQRARGDLHQITHQVIEELQIAWPEREIVFEHEGESEGQWDADRLAQVTTNLVTNALRYSPGGTPVRVRSCAGAALVELEVHNQGRPIPPQLIPRIFEAMQRGAQDLDRSTRGVGLGLFIVDQIVRAHGGSVAVQSSAEAGTTFTVRLPRTSTTSS